MGEDTRSDAAKPFEMRVSVLRWSSVATALFALGISGCAGSSGTGLTIPQAQSFGQPGAPGQGGGGGSDSRQRAVDGAVTMSADTHQIPLPKVDGFAIAIQLGTPGPSPSPAPSDNDASPAGSPSPKGRHAPAGGLTRLRAVASPSPSPSESPSPAPSDSASPVASGKPSGAPSAKPTARPRIVTKTTTYPDDAPVAPTPDPTGDVETFYKRQALVRGFLQPPVDVSLYGLGAVRFTIPGSEQIDGRGFTIAFFEAGKKHHEKLLAYDSGSKLDGDVVASSIANAPIAMKKGQGYLVVLYADEQAATPGPHGPMPSGYPQPGNNPFATPLPAGYPQPGQPGYQPGQPAPYSTQTPFGAYPSQTPHY